MASSPRWHPDEARGIIKRIVIEGTLTLSSSAHFGNGDGADLTDMPLLTDADGRSLLSGTALAGALRAYLCERVQGFRVSETKTSISVLLFGGLCEDVDGEQSSLIVEDALGTPADPKHQGVEIRSGVRLDPESRTASEGAIFNIELWQGGMTFPLRLELLVLAPDRPGASPEADLRSALATALAGLHPGLGGITLGARKRRGFGRVRTSGWQVKEYDLTTLAGLRDWVRQGGKSLTDATHSSSSICNLLRTTEMPDRRSLMTLEAEFFLTPLPGALGIGSLLIRASGGRDDTGPDMVHLETRGENGTLGAPVAGTAVGGALRARCNKILHTLCAVSGEPDASEKAKTLADDLFGPMLSSGSTKVRARAGRLRVEEHLIIKPCTDLVQSRGSIDRFTGGAYATALFNEQPVFSRGAGTRVYLRFQLEDPRDYEAGLLLHLLKDLWTCDLPLGGESSVGRGRLWGISAGIGRSSGKTSSVEHWRIEQADAGLQVAGDRPVMEKWASQLCEHLGVPHEPKH